MKQTVLFFLLCMILVNAAWGEWKVTCNEHPMTDTPYCFLGSSSVNGNFIALFTLMERGQIYVKAQPGILDKEEKQQLRVDKNNPWDSVKVESDSAIFVNGPVGNAPWAALVREFKKGNKVRLSMWQWPSGHIDETFSLIGFTRAYAKFKQLVKKRLGYDVDKPE
jgi:invasion protein IalB